MCDAAALEDLSTKPVSVFKDKFALAGMDSSEALEHYVSFPGGNCFDWGSPYRHKEVFATKKCQAGSRPSVATCRKEPVDPNRRRLCPCEILTEPAPAPLPAPLPVPAPLPAPTLAPVPLAATWIIVNPGASCDATSSALGLVCFKF